MLSRCTGLACLYCAPVITRELGANAVERDVERTAVCLRKGQETYVELQRQRSTHGTGFMVNKKNLQGTSTTTTPQPLAEVKQVKEVSKAKEALFNLSVLAACG